jgi:hypothetical protein
LTLTSFHWDLNLKHLVLVHLLENGIPGPRKKPTTIIPSLLKKACRNLVKFDLIDVTCELAKQKKPCENKVYSYDSNIGSDKCEKCLEKEKEKERNDFNALLDVLADGLFWRY